MGDGEEAEELIEEKEVEKWLKELINATSKIFPTTREWLKSLDSLDSLDALDAPTEEGVYIILSPEDEVLHVGKTSADGGIHERLQEYVDGDPPPPFTRYYLRGKGERLLRERYKFKCIVVPNRRIRAYLKVYATVRLLMSNKLLP